MIMTMKLTPDEEEQKMKTANFDNAPYSLSSLKSGLVFCCSAAKEKKILAFLAACPTKKEQWDFIYKSLDIYVSYLAA